MNKKILWNMIKEMFWWIRGRGTFENYLLWNPEENVKKLYGIVNILSEEKRKPKTTKWKQKDKQ